jgi:hypothetical protein
LRATLLRADNHDRDGSQIKQFGYTLHAKTFVRSPVLRLRYALQCTRALRCNAFDAIM